MFYPVTFSQLSVRHNKYYSAPNIILRSLKETILWTPLVYIHARLNPFPGLSSSNNIVFYPEVPDSNPAPSWYFFLIFYKFQKTLAKAKCLFVEYTIKLYKFFYPFCFKYSSFQGIEPKIIIFLIVLLQNFLLLRLKL